jgi:hypothetical protein
MHISNVKYGLWVGLVLNMVYVSGSIFMWSTFSYSMGLMLNQLANSPYITKVIVICGERLVHVIGKELIEPCIIHILQAPIQNNDLEEHKKLSHNLFCSSNSTKVLILVVVGIRLLWSLSQFISWVGWTYFLLTDITFAFIWICGTTAVTISIVSVVRILNMKNVKYEFLKEKNLDEIIYKT